MTRTTQMHGTEKRFGAVVIVCPQSARGYGLQTPSRSTSINLDWRCGP